MDSSKLGYSSLGCSCDDADRRYRQPGLVGSVRRRPPVRDRGSGWPGFGSRNLFLLLLSLWLFGLGSAWADTFKVSDIRIEGLQRISAGTVFSLLPVKIGDSTTDEVTAKSIRALYASGFFDDVKVER